MGIKGNRFLSVFIDLLIINALIGVLGFVWRNEFSLWNSLTTDGSLNIRVSYDLFYYLIYFVFFDIFKEGISIGKKATGLMIVNHKG
ncbi:RDD family protein [Muriicola sp.]|uniref:RDD family protein n=1 Tax=Muriicola sp. TaxID=2020856 RepID=UPI00356634F2